MKSLLFSHLGGPSRGSLLLSKSR